MTYKNNECPVCRRKFTDEDDIVVCPECGTPHHRDCWQSVGSCANGALHAQNFAWVNTAAPEGPPRQETGNRQSRGPRADTRKCPRCGGINDPERTDCEFCGAPLGYNRRPFVNMGGLDPDVIPTNISVDGIPAEEEAAYIGPSGTKYIFRFLEMDRRDSKLSWNWAAAIFGPLWCFYRKMYSVGLVYLLVSIVIAVICTPAGFTDYLRGAVELFAASPDYESLMEYITQNAPVYSGWQEFLTTAFQTVGAVLLGLFGNHLYRNKVKNSIMNIRAQASDMETYLYLLARKGRISVAMPVLAAIFLLYGQSFITIGFSMLFGR